MLACNLIKTATSLLINIHKLFLCTTGLNSSWRYCDIQWFWNTKPFPDKLAASLFYSSKSSQVYFIYLQWSQYLQHLNSSGNVVMSFPVSHCSTKSCISLTCFVSFHKWLYHLLRLSIGWSFPIDKPSPSGLNFTSFWTLFMEITLWDDILALIFIPIHPISLSNTTNVPSATSLLSHNTVV